MTPLRTTLTLREYHILLVLLQASDDQPYLSAAQISAASYRDSDGYIRESTDATLKALLRLCSRDQLVMHQSRTKGGNGRNIICYELTESGRETMRAETIRLAGVLRRAQARIAAYDEGRVLDQSKELTA